MDKAAYLEAISRNVEALRKARDWSQEDLGRKAGLSQKVISNLENAVERDIHPTLNTIMAVADALDVSLYLLMTSMKDQQIEAVKSANGSRAISRLVDTYMSLSPGGRQTVDRILDLESRANQASSTMDERRVA